MHRDTSATYRQNILPSFCEHRGQVTNTKGSVLAAEASRWAQGQIFRTAHAHKRTYLARPRCTLLNVSGSFSVGFLPISQRGSRVELSSKAISLPMINNSKCCERQGHISAWLTAARSAGRHCAEASATRGDGWTPGDARGLFTPDQGHERTAEKRLSVLSEQTTEPHTSL